MSCARRSKWCAKMAMSSTSYSSWRMAPLGLVRRPPKVRTVWLNSVTLQAVDDEACCEASRQALVSASECPLSIAGILEMSLASSAQALQSLSEVMIGVGDGPWDVMKDWETQKPSTSTNSKGVGGFLRRHHEILGRNSTMDCPAGTSTTSSALAEYFGG